MCCHYYENSEKMPNLGSTQANESMNQLIATQAPKAKHLGGSFSLSHQLAAAVSKKLRQKYLSQVLTVSNNDVSNKSYKAKNICMHVT